MSLTKEVILGAIADEMQRAIDNAERPKGGQHAGSPSGDFWPVGPGVIARFRWWLREIRSAREAQKLDGETYRSLYLSTQYGEAIFAGALFEHIERVVHDLVQRELQVEKLAAERDAALTMLRGEQEMLALETKLHKDACKRFDDARSEVGIALCASGYWTADEAIAAVGKVFDTITERPVPK